MPRRDPSRRPPVRLSRCSVSAMTLLLGGPQGAEWLVISAIILIPALFVVFLVLVFSRRH